MPPRRRPGGAAPAARARPPPRVSLLDLPTDVLVHIATFLPNRFAVLPLVCKALKDALQPPCAAWENLTLNEAGLEALAAAAGGGARAARPGDVDVRAANPAAVRAMGALRLAAPRLHSLDINMSSRSAPAAAHALRLLLGDGAGGGVPPLAPHLSRVSIQTRRGYSSDVAQFIEAGGAAALLNGRQLTSLRLALLEEVNTYGGGMAEWARRCEAIVAAAPAALLLRELTLVGFREHHLDGEGRPRLWLEPLLSLSQLVVDGILPRMAATLEVLVFENFGMLATLQGTWRGRLTRLTRLTFDKHCSGFRTANGWRDPFVPLNLHLAGGGGGGDVGGGGGGGAGPVAVEAFPALRELALPIDRGEAQYRWVSTCRRLTAVTLFAGVAYSAAKARELRHPPLGVLGCPGLRRLVCETPPGLPCPRSLGVECVIHGNVFAGRLTTLIYLSHRLTNSKRIEFPGPRGRRGGRPARDAAVLPNLAELDLRGQMLPEPPKFRNACTSLRVLRLGFPAYGALVRLPSATGVVPAADDPAAVAAAARRAFSLTSIAADSIRGALPGTLEDLTLENVCLTVDAAACPQPKAKKAAAECGGGGGDGPARPAQQAPPATVAALVAAVLATKTAPGLRVLRLRNASTASPIVDALLGEGGAVLAAGYARHRRRRRRDGGPPLRVVGDDLISEVPDLAAAVEAGDGGGGGGDGGPPPPPPPPPEDQGQAVPERVATPPPPIPPECAFQ